MQVGIYTIKGTLFQGEAEKVIAKTPMGEIAILKNHIPLVSTLLASVIRLIEKGGVEKTIQVKSGVIEVRPENHIVILASQ